MRGQGALLPPPPLGPPWGGGPGWGDATRGELLAATECGLEEADEGRFATDEAVAAVRAKFRSEGDWINLPKDL